jgi:hypothetical protein
LIEIPRYSKQFSLSPEAQYFEYLRDKRVVIVGPAAYLVGQGRGKDIDAYDVIVRLNLGCPVPEEIKSYIGSRTDVLYHVVMNQRQVRKRPDILKMHSKEQIQAWKNDGVNWFVSKRSVDTPRVRKLAELIGGVISWTVISNPDMRRLELMLRTNPNMGTVAIWHIMQSQAKSLYVTGCDFHRTGYHPGYGGFTPEQAAKGAGSVTCWGQIPQPKNRVNNMHDIDKQLKYLARLRVKDRRFTADKVLSKMLDEVVL